MSFQRNSFHTCVHALMAGSAIAAILNALLLWQTRAISQSLGGSYVAFQEFGHIPASSMTLILFLVIGLDLKLRARQLRPGFNAGERQTRNNHVSDARHLWRWSWNGAAVGLCLACIYGVTIMWSWWLYSDLRGHGEFFHESPQTALMIQRMEKLGSVMPLALGAMGALALLSLLLYERASIEADLGASPT